MEYLVLLYGYLIFFFPKELIWFFVDSYVVENNALSFGDSFESNAAAATSWNKYAVDNNLTPEQTQAGLDKIAKGDMPDSTNITKVIVDGYQDGVMIAGAWYLGPAASAGKVLGGGLLGLAANSGYQVYDLNQPQNANKSWDYLGSATSFTTGMMAPGRGVLANTGIAMGGAFFTDGPNTASLAGAGIGAGLGGAFGKYAPTAVGKILGNDPVPGFIYELGGGAVSEFTNGIIKDFNNPQAPEKKKINENFVGLFNSPSVLLPVFYNSVTWSRFGCISVFFFQK
ncbi:adhesin [Escherichia coli]|uniref:adhesin n=1 Tax=Escherichia coli TaxID=562 RepID=UPI00224567D2|nr:adhesin [Escherichia coli]MCX0145224.1 adhesin [Escherichia coli]